MAEARIPDNRQDVEEPRIPSIPSGAEKEILDRLFREMHMNSDQMADVLERYGVMGDPDALQRSYRKRTAQRLMSSFRDDEGKRTILAGKGGEYYVVPLCSDLTALHDVEKRLEQQEQGLHKSSGIVSRRIGILAKMIERLKSGRGKREVNAQ